MLVVLSPSKTLDYDSPTQATIPTQPALLEEAEQLIEILRGFDIDELRDLMGISEKLAVLNVERYDAFSVPFDADNARPAIEAFDGDVYRDIELDQYDADDVAYLQDHARILSGLYGLLRPLDLMQPYRLEMVTRLANERGKDLYEFWGAKITDAVNAAVEAQGDDVLLNLASNAYFNSIDTDRLDGRVVNVDFKDLRNGNYKVISFYLKRLRGTMTDWMVRNRASNPEDLKAFDERNYYFSDERSTADNYVFLRDEKP